MHSLTPLEEALTIGLACADEHAMPKINAATVATVLNSLRNAL
jgi:hypothetical protein